ncbi:MAG: zf-HC2 domain-containing protein, partial [Candidatus Velamenicoccus archaeovorus]
MDCDRAQAALSARMDGERLTPRVSAELDRHVATCRRCAAFERAAWRLRERTRIQPAPPVPDLVEPIMAAVRREAPVPVKRVRPAAVLEGTPVPTGRRGPAAPLRSPAPARRLAPVAAALVIGLVAGSVAVGGPWRRGGPTPLASAAEVSRHVAAAAARLSAYQARFVITERHFAPDVPVRELAMDVWFQAPDRFRLDVRDRTRYPGPGRTPTDLQLVVNGSARSTTSPSVCPIGVCPPRT